MTIQIDPYSMAVRLLRDYISENGFDVSGMGANSCRYDYNVMNDHSWNCYLSVEGSARERQGRKNMFYIGGTIHISCGSDDTSDEWLKTDTPGVFITHRNFERYGKVNEML